MDKNNSHKTMIQKEERAWIRQFTQNNDTKRREAWIRTIHTKQCTKRREAWIRTIHTKQWYKKKRGMDKNNSHKTMVQKEERHG